MPLPQGRDVVTEGARILSMAYARVVFGGAPSASVAAAVMFRTAFRAAANSHIVVQTEGGYGLTCRPADGYHPVTTPIGSCIEQGSKIRLPSDRIIRIFAAQNSVKILSEFRKNSQNPSEILKI